jgi:type I restriction enzyme, S subunit
MPPARSASDAPKGRKTTAQGNALGPRHPTNPSPEGAQNWKIRKLGEVVPDDAPILYGILQPGPNIEGGIPYVRPTEIDNDIIQLNEVRCTSVEISKKYKRSYLKAGDIVLSMVGTIGKVAVVPPALEGGNITQSAVRIRPNTSIVDGSYLAWLLRSPILRTQFDAKRLGTAIPRLNVRDIRDFEVPLPPLPEQIRIVARIEELISRLDAGVAALRHAKAQLQRYRQSALAAAVTGQLTQAWREQHLDTESASTLLERVLDQRRKKWSGKGKYKDPSPLAEGVFEALPPEWEISSLEALTDANRPICYGILMPKDNVPDGVLYVKVRDMRGDRINLKSLQRTTPEIAAKYERASLKEGDLLLSIRGTYGRVALIPPELDGGNITQDSARLAVSDFLSRGYVACAIRSHTIQTHFRKVARGVAVKGVNIGDVKPTPIPIPPLAEQQQILAEVETRTTAIDHLEAELERQITRSNRLRRSILESAFSGNL